MGFLDRLVSDVVRNTTGLKVGSLVRMVGGKNLMMLGGAALAGGFAADQMRTPQQGASPPNVPPPGPIPSGPPPQGLPPLPGQSAQPAPPPPELPPLPGQAPPTPDPRSDEGKDAEQRVTFAVVRTMVAAALADGHLAPEEKQLIQKHLAESPLSAEQTSQIHQDLVLPPSPDELLSLTSNQEDRELLFRFAALVAEAQEGTSQIESAWLGRLAARFGISEDRRRQLMSEVGASLG